MSKPLYNLAGVDYNGPFYAGEGREDLRAMVTTYVPHAFTGFEKGDPRRGLCRICGFPSADAACNKEGNRA